MKKLLIDTRQKTQSESLDSRPPRHSAALTVLTKGSLNDGLIRLHRVLFVVLYDENAGRSSRWTRLAGYGASRVPWGVRCGGTKNCRFDKNADLKAKPRATGLRLDTRSRAVIRAAEQLRKEIAAPSDQPPRAIPSRIRLPKFWAGFGPSDAERIQGDGPELLSEIHITGCSIEELMRDRRRDHHGLTLYPLSWVSHHWERFRAVFVDLGGFPKQQVFDLSDPTTNLCGYREACEFDFFHSPFRENHVDLASR
jgi:hypothetical protein